MSNVYADFANETAKLATSTPPSMPIPGREQEMKRNNGGGFTFTMDHWGILDRFIMIGSEGGSYYVGERDTTKMSFDVVKKCIAEDGVRTVNRAVEYSLAGRAPKNDPAVTVLALAASFGNDETQKAAYDALPKVARTGTWLFQFVSILNSLGKWNAAAKRGVAAWYTTKSVEKMTMQMLKYQSRNGWAHRDVLRLAHVKPENELVGNVFKYAVKGPDALELGAPVPPLLVAFESAKRSTDKREVLRLIEDYDQLTWEMVPTQFLSDRDVLFALLKNMGLTAVIRKLGALTAHGVIAPMSEGLKLVRSKIEDVEALKKARVHPITILMALKQYSAGQGSKGSLTWSPNQQLVDTLDSAFYAAFATSEDTKENYLLGIDISGSMTTSPVLTSSSKTPVSSWMVSRDPGQLYAAEVAAVMGMAVARNQSNYHMVGFKHNLEVLRISPTMRLDAALNAMTSMHWNGGATDPAKTFEYAKDRKIPVDKFVIITDNEVNCGTQAPTQALKKYRQATGINAKAIVIGTTVSEFTIADPKDPGMLDIAGFDSAAPQLIANL